LPGPESAQRPLEQQLVHDVGTHVSARTLFRWFGGGEDSEDPRSVPGPELVQHHGAYIRLGTVGGGDPRPVRSGLGKRLLEEVLSRGMVTFEQECRA